MAKKKHFCALCLQTVQKLKCFTEHLTDFMFIFHIRVFFKFIRNSFENQFKRIVWADKRIKNAYVGRNFSIYQWLFPYPPVKEPQNPSIFFGKGAQTPGFWHEELDAAVA